VVVLGVLPGLAGLAYSMLSFRSVDMSADLVDCDVLRGTGHAETAPIWKVGKSARVHRMVMGVVFERDPPTVLALGPPLNPEEPEGHIEIVRGVLVAMATGLKARIVTFDERKQVQRTLERMYDGRMEVGERGLRKAVRCALTEPLPTVNRRVMLATAVALAGAHEVRSPPEPSGDG
jgi:hypothetical protein